MERIRICPNTAYFDCAVIDSVPSTISGGSSYLNIAEGARYLHVSSPSSQLELAYINKAGNLQANCCILTDYYEPLTVIKAYTSYSGAATTLFSGSVYDFDNLDYRGGSWFIDFDTTVTGVEAFSVRASGTAPKLYKTFFSKSVDFEFIDSAVQIEPVNEVIEVDRQYLEVDYKLNLRLMAVTDTQISELQQLQLTSKPFFIYDESAKNIPQQLWYGLLKAMPVVTVYPDVNEIEIEFYRLKDYPRSNPNPIE